MKTAVTIIILFFATILSAQQAAVPPAGPVAPAVQPAADAKPYGFHLGTVSGSIGVAGAHLTGNNGLHPGALGSLDVGLGKYVGVFMQGGWVPMRQSASACYYGYCASASVNSNLYTFGGGFEFVGTNRSRFVPYGKLGFAYAGGTESGTLSGGGSYGSYSYATSAPAIITGGGVRAYITHKVGVDTQLALLRTVGSNGGGWVIAPTVGVFFQSR